MPNSSPTQRITLISTALLVGLTFALILVKDTPWFKDWLTKPPTIQDSVYIYWSKEAGDHTTTDAAIRIAPQEADTPDERLVFALEELLTGPKPEEKQNGFFSEIPPGTRFLGAKFDSRSTTINLSGEFTQGGGSTSMQMRLEELKKTLLSVSYPKPIYLEVNGKVLTSLGTEGVQVDEPITR